MTKKGAIVKDYCKAYADLQDLTLAKKIYSENKHIFNSVDNTRDLVRYYRGHRGNGDRAKIKDKELFKPLTHDTRKKPEPINTGAKVLILDIETAPIRAYVWGVWNENIHMNAIQSDYFILTWAAKWLFEDKVYSGKLNPNEVSNQDDHRIMMGIWRLLNEADIVIAHNAEKFDIPKLNSRFIINDIEPPLPYQVIDTLKHIRRKFSFTHNKLDYVNKILKLTRKSETNGFELWERCMKGEREALNKMEEYNINDVRILEDLYLTIRHWITPHPNMGLFILDNKQSRCACCGSEKLKDTGKKYYTSSNAFALLKCESCGSNNRKRLGELKINDKRYLLISSAK